MMEIITKRPDRMPFDEYRRRLTDQNKRLRNYLRGDHGFVWISCEIVEKKEKTGMGKETIRIYKRLVNGTFYGCVRDLIYPEKKTQISPKQSGTKQPRTSQAKEAAEPPKRKTAWLQWAAAAAVMLIIIYFATIL